MNLPFLEPFNLISTRISVRCCLLSLLSQCGEHIPMQISLLSLTDEELHAKLDYLGYISHTPNCMQNWITWGGK
jgi:hypothetical protein